MDEIQPEHINDNPYTANFGRASNIATCSSCGKTKFKAYFYHRKYKDGYRIVQPCRVCWKTKQRNKYYIKKESLPDPQEKENYRKRRELILFLGQHPCVDCGESDVLVLEFDHVEEKSFAISYMLGNPQFTWEDMVQEIKKCEVRCANCHRRKTARETYSYRIEFIAKYLGGEN